MRWSEPAALALLSAAAFALSGSATAWARAHARRRGLLDLPGERRSHGLPTPRGGGVGIALAGVCTCVLLAWSAGSGWAWVGAGLVLVAGAGWWDDHRPLPAWPRLLAHAVAGACLAVGAVQQGAPVAVAVAALLVVPVLVNVWNFIDGIDGLAASQALLGSLALACVLDGPGRVLAVVVAAASGGFLPFNLPRARIFLGDVGSGALGYLLAVLLVAGLASGPPGEWPLLLLPVAVCLVDAGLTLGRRMVRGEPWWQPHAQHLYQRLARRYGHPRVTFLYAGWTALAIGIMLGLCREAAIWAWIGTVGFCGLSMAAWWRLHLGHGNGSEGIGR